MRRKMITTLVLALLLLVAFPVTAAGPFIITVDGTSSPQWIQVADEPDGTPYPADTALIFPDSDVTVSYWDWRGDPGSRYMIRLNNSSGPPENPGEGHAFADSVETIFAGTISRPDFPFKAIYVTPAAATDGKIEWFE